MPELNIRFQRRLLGNALMRGMTITVLSVVSLLGWSSGASAQDGEVILKTDQDRYRAGDSLTLRLENHTDKTVGYNLCTTTQELECRAHGEWGPLDRCVTSKDSLKGRPYVCQLMMEHMSSGETDEISIRLRPDLPSGTYRYKDEVELGDSIGVVIATDSFRVLEKR